MILSQLGKNNFNPRPSKIKIIRFESSKTHPGESFKIGYPTWLVLNFPRSGNSLCLFAWLLNRF